MKCRLCDGLLPSAYQVGVRGRPIGLDPVLIDGQPLALMLVCPHCGAWNLISLNDHGAAIDVADFKMQPTRRN